MTALLSLPGSVTETSLSLPESMGFDDWREVGKQLCGAEKSIGWWIGDWWAFGQHRYGERAKAAAEGIFGRAFNTLVNAGTVSRKIETPRRRGLLSFSHHAEVAPLPAEQADALLDRAEREQLSTRELRTVVHQHKAAAKLGARVANDETCTVADLNVLAESGSKFGCIYADPPWLYDNQGTRASTENHYGGMTVDELCELPVKQLAADDAHLHLWTTNAFLFECPRIFEAWGFEFRSSFIWVKPQMGIGNYWRNSHEFLLTAIRGDAKSFNDHSIKSWLECDRGRHSGKPEQVRGMLEKASVGPYLEMFGRLPATGWAVWGNQIERNLFHQNVREVA